MTRRTGLLATTALSALVIGLSGGGQARAADLITKAPPPPPIGWWFDGYVEFGGRGFINDNGGGTGANFTNGNNNPVTHLNSGPFGSLGKFYEYRDLRDGPFGDLFLAGGSRDGLYQYLFLGKNIGYRDQSYLFDWSKAGEYYVTLGFDQLPHVYNNNATTLFGGAGTDSLTVAPGVGARLSTLLGPPAASGSNTVSAATAAQIGNFIEGNLNGFQLGFDRYTGTAEGRWTPDDSWDVKANYNITVRDGTQPMGALTYNSVERGGRIILEVPKPVHDETHDANVNAEYAGVTPWGKKYNINFGYGLSLYNDDADSFTFQNPMVAANGALTPFNNFMSLPPSNIANTFRMNGSLDMPWKSRWVMALNYTHGQQDSDVGPFSINPAALAAATAANGAPATLTGSTDFHSDAVLVNNIFTTKWTPEVQQTTRYRYYSYDASHDNSINYFLLADSSNTIDIADDNIHARGIDYTKQNASSDVVWRPAAYRWLTLGGGIGWEQWDRDFRGQYQGLPDVAVTNEFTGQVFANLKPYDWSQFRASYAHGERRFDGNYMQNIGGNQEQCAGPPTGINCTNFRAYDLANRDRDKLNVYFDWYAAPGLTITPTGGFRFDDYSSGMILDSNGGGVIRDEAWNAGIEVAWVINPSVTLMGSYTHEDGKKEIWFHSGPAFETDTIDNTDTVMLGANFVIIPDKFDLKVAYTYVNSTASIGGNPANAAASFPNQTEILNRFDVQAKYRVDRDFMRRLGVTSGETFVKLRYLWEKNEVSDWAAVNWNYMYLFNGDTSQNKNVFLGWDNPNYDVQLVMGSIGYKW